MTGSSFDVRIWQVEKRADARSTWRVRWRVARRRFARTFTTRALADSFRAQLLEATRTGESFSIETGLPYSMARREMDVSCYVHARDFMKATWPTAAAKSRISLLETLSVALPVLIPFQVSAPDSA